MNFNSEKINTVTPQLMNSVSLNVCEMKLILTHFQEPEFSFHKPQIFQPLFADQVRLQEVHRAD